MLPTDNGEKKAAGPSRRLVCAAGGATSERLLHGHWPIAGANVHLEAGVDPSSVIAEHEAHCHIGPANCGGGESMVGTPFAGEDNGGLSLPGSEMKFDAGHDYVPQAGHAARILQPPRLANDADV